MRFLPYQQGKYLNVARIDAIDTTANPPTVTISGVVYAVDAPYVPAIRAAVMASLSTPPAAQQTNIVPPPPPLT